MLILCRQELVNHYLTWCVVILGDGGPLLVSESDPVLDGGVLHWHQRLHSPHQLHGGDRGQHWVHQLYPAHDSDDHDDHEDDEDEDGDLMTKRNK